VRRKLIETGAVDVMVAIRSNFFYTRSVPCELWFLNRAKPEAYRDKVLMLDARSIYRQVTRKIYDFSPEQLQNLLAIVWLYRGQGDRFLELVAGYLERTLAQADLCFAQEDEDGQPVNLLEGFVTTLAKLENAWQPFIATRPGEGAPAELLGQLQEEKETLAREVEAFRQVLAAGKTNLGEQGLTNAVIQEATQRLAPLAEQSRSLVKQADLLCKLAGRLIEVCETELNARESDLWVNR